MKTWNAPELEELSVALTADGSLDWDEEGEIVCGSNADCKYDTNRKCLES